MFEAGSSRHRPWARQSMGVALVRQEADRVGRKFYREIRDVFQLRYSPRFRAVCQVTVRENDYRHHVLNGDAARFDGHPEAIRRRRRGQNRNRSLRVAAEERLQQVRLFGLGGKAG